MTERAKLLAGEYAPWRRDLGWRPLLVEGSVLFALGLFVYLAPGTTKDVLRPTIGGILALISLVRIRAGFRDLAGQAPNPMTAYNLVRGGAGAMLGLVVLSEPLTDYIDADGARYVLAIGLTVYGLVGLAGAALTRRAGNLTKGALLSAVLSIAFGLLLFFNLRSNTEGVERIGSLAMICGGLLAGYALFLRYRAGIKNSGAGEPVASPGDAETVGVGGEK